MPDMTDMQLMPLGTSRTETITTALHVWLLSKTGESSSTRTEGIYQDYLTAFRAQLQAAGYDLDGLPTLRPVTPDDHEQALSALALAAQGWASATQRKETISASTYNHRLAVLSSFYTFAKKRRLLMMDNPIALVDRRKTQEYASARPLSQDQVKQILKAIDRTTLAGKRDYALLLLFFSTGRRAREVLSLHWKDVHLADNTVTLHFHCKGNKELYDTLEPRVYRAFLEYLHALFGTTLTCLPSEQRLWLSLSNKNLRKPLTQRGLADICKAHLGTMKIHTTRHTFAHSMSKSGASVTDIQARLGHSNVATTGRYLQVLGSADNPHATRLLDYLHVEE